MKKGHRAAAQDAKKKDRLVKQQLRRARAIRKYGDEDWKNDWKKFSEQLSGIGLTIKDVAGDGNCMFRAIADQMEGDPNRHDHYRQRICDFVERHEEDFAPFVEDDRTLAQHVSEMRRNGTWGGHMELQAASMLLGINFCIHQLAQPRWEIVNHTGNARNPIRVLHLSYHDGDHYASVRNAKEPTTHSGPPMPITLPSTPASFPSASSSSSANGGSDFASWQEDLVLRSTVATNVYFVRAVLIETGGDTDAAVEYIISLCSDGELDETFQNEFAYEHGIFPEGGFDGEFLTSLSAPSTLPPSATMGDSDDFDPNLLKFAADLDAAEIERIIAEEEAALLRATSPTHKHSDSRSSASPSKPSSSTNKGSSGATHTTSSSSASSSHAGHKHAKHTDSETRSVSPTPDSAGKHGKKGQKESTASSSSSAPSAAPHPKLEKFYQNQHMTNKQRNAMRRMEKEKPPQQPTQQPPQTPATPETPAEGAETPIVDLGSLRI